MVLRLRALILMTDDITLLKHKKARSLQSSGSSDNEDDKSDIIHSENCLFSNWQQILAKDRILNSLIFQPGPKCLAHR